MKQKEPIFNFAEPSIPIFIGVLVVIHFLGLALLDLEQIRFNLALFPLGSSDLPSTPIRQAYSLMTHGFLHADLSHLIMNSASLLIFGLITFRGVRALKGYGRKAFMFFWAIFWLGVIVGGLFQWGYWSITNVTYATAIGASGGASALFATAGWAIRGKLGLGQFAMAYCMLNIILVLAVSNVAWAAHLGGFIAGAGLAPYWVKPESAGMSIFR